MNRYASLSDDFYINMNLSTEMELSNNRETILHFAEQMQKCYPEMRNFYAREKGNYVLEEDKDSGAYRWCSIEPSRIASGQVNPREISTALEQHRRVLEIAPYELSLSPLDCEAFDLLIGFDFNCKANHNQVVAEALGFSPAFEKLASLGGTKFISHEPTMTLALDEDCRLQIRVGVETRTTPYHIRSGEYQEDQLSVYVTARHYGSLEASSSYVEMLETLSTACFEVLDTCVVESIVEPLAKTIAMS